jgi:hypothetical protein
MVFAGMLHIVHMDGKTRAAVCGERYVDRFEGVCLCIRHFWSQIWIARRWV